MDKKISKDSRTEYEVDLDTMADMMTPEFLVARQLLDLRQVVHGLGLVIHKHLQLQTDQQAELSVAEINEVMQAFHDDTRLLEDVMARLNKREAAKAFQLSLALARPDGSSLPH